MELKNYITWKIRKIFKYPDENDRAIIENVELVVLPTPHNYEPSSSMTAIGNFKFVENLIDYFNSTEVSTLLIDHSKVLLFKLQINNTSCKFNKMELNELGQKCAKNSIVIFLATKDGNEFFLYWKSKNIQELLMFKIRDEDTYMNDLRLFEFISTFLTDSLRRGYLGLYSEIKIDSDTVTFGLHLLADHRNYNLLLIAAEKGDLYITIFMLDAGYSTDSYDTNAQTLAYNGRHFEILLELLKSNLTYPKMIKIEECPIEIKEFYEVSRSLNEAMMTKNSTIVEEILLQCPEIRHFYNLNNESALAFALRNKLFDMYGLLISKNVMFGPNEKFSKIRETLKDSEREELREIHYKESKFLPDNHMHVLLSNSRLAPSTTQHKQKYEIIQKSFEVLNANPLIKIILMIVAASRNFRIVFDFNRNSIEVVDPTVNANTKGLFYSSGRIYVAAKELLNSRTKFEALGTLCHELCHYAMNAVYKNLARPYLIDDDKTEKEFIEISEICEKNREKEELIDFVYKCYPISMQHAELIVRVPHLIMRYFNDKEQFQKVRSYFIKLFEIYENKIVNEMTEALPVIEAKAEVEAESNKKKIRNLILILVAVVLLAVTGIVSAIFITRSVTEKPNYKFLELSIENQKTVREAPVSYKNVYLKFEDLYPKNSLVYETLISDHISQMLDGKSLNLSDSHYIYLEKLVTHEWGSLATKLKNKILNSTINFQNQSLKYEVLHKINPDLFVYLTSSQILDILDNKELIIHKMVKKAVNFYVERKVTDEDIYAIYFLFMEYVQGHEMFKCNSYNKINNTMSFSAFYHEFRTQDYLKQKRKIKEIKQDSIFKKCSTSQFFINSFIGTEIYPVYRLSFYTSLQFKFEKILKIANMTKIFILSGEAGTGKTVMLKELTNGIKNKFKTHWISYIDLKDHKNVYQNITSLEDARKMLEKIFELSSKNEFERKIFEHLFNAGHVTLLWNGFDEISPQFSATILTILNLIKDKSNIIQYVCTRSLYSDMLKDNLKAQTYSLVPFDEANQIAYIMSVLISKNFSDDNILEYSDKIMDIVKFTDSDDGFDTPLMLQMITDLILNDVELSDTKNLYKIYEKFVVKKFNIWRKTEISDHVVETIFNTDFKMMKFYQSYALKSELQDHQINLVHFWLLKLELMNQKTPDELTDDEVSRMGILYINDPKNFKFSHKTFVEFFIAQYFIENVYNVIGTPSEVEVELRLMMFYYCIEYHGVRKFIISFLDTENVTKPKLFNPEISRLLKSKFQKIFRYPAVYDDDIFTFMIAFFKNDHEVLLKLLQIDENETAYTATFNYIHVERLTFDRLAIKSLARPYLNNNEFDKFVHGRNQKGIILFSMYCLKNKDRTIYNISHDEYVLDDKLLENSNPMFVFKSIANMLTKDELKELLKSEIIFKPLKSKDDYIFDKNNWNLIEAIFSKSEQKEIIEHIFKYHPHFINEDDTIFLLDKMDQHWSDIEIFKLFYDYDILRYASNSNTIFNISWNFFVNHTTREQQIAILRQKQEKPRVLINDPFDFCIPLNLLLFSFVSYDRDAHHNVVKIYESYFNTTEIQEIILSSSSDSPLAVFMLCDRAMFENLIEFLKKKFTGKKKVIENFIMRPIAPTNKNIFEILKNYKDPWNLIELLTGDDL